MKNLLLLLFCFLFVMPPVFAAKSPATLVHTRQQVTAEFGRLDRGLKRAAKELGKTGLTGDDARRVLAATCQEFSYALDCSAIDTHGRMKTVEPARYHSVEGTDISDQSHIRQILKRHKPVLSAVFRSVEGDEAVDAEYPVFSPAGRFIGAVSILFKPEQFLGEIIRPVVKGGNIDIWAMERGGRILYDVDREQVGLNLFTSPQFDSYKELLLLAKKIAQTERGNGVYRFRKANLTDRDVRKKACWESVTLYGTAWRLVGVQLEREGNALEGHHGK
jgi:hypothetical protein